jgi:hypothetical protein
MKTENCNEGKNTMPSMEVKAKSLPAQWVKTFSNTMRFADSKKRIILVTDNQIVSHGP